jgi:hypothetical protein
MAIVLLVAIIATNFLLSSKLVREGLENLEESTTIDKASAVDPNISEAAPIVKKSKTNEDVKKQKLVDYKGGKCIKCGYNKYIGNLAFHHLDPSKKDFIVYKSFIKNENKTSNFNQRIQIFYDNGLIDINTYNKYYIVEKESFGILTNSYLDLFPKLDSVNSETNKNKYSLMFIILLFILILLINKYLSLRFSIKTLFENLINQFYIIFKKIIKKKKYGITIIFLILILLSFIFKQSKIESFQDKEPDTDSPSIHVLIATIGKESIFNMLDTLKKQLTINDYLTIVFDGPDLPNIDKVKTITSDFLCKTNVIVEEKNLGFWGHAIRNKHNKLAGDFVFHIDDDDNISPDCMKSLHSICKNKNTIYIFKMDVGEDKVIWKTKEIIFGEIGTPMGIIPTKINSTSEFTYRYGGDYDFYKKLENDGNNIEYVDKVIYIVKPKK